MDGSARETGSEAGDWERKSVGAIDDLELDEGDHTEPATGRLSKKTDPLPFLISSSLTRNRRRETCLQGSRDVNPNYPIQT